MIKSQYYYINLESLKEIFLFISYFIKYFTRYIQFYAIIILMIFYQKHIWFSNLYDNHAHIAWNMCIWMKKRNVIFSTCNIFELIFQHKTLLSDAQCNFEIQLNWTWVEIQKIDQHQKIIISYVARYSQ